MNGNIMTTSTKFVYISHDYRKAWDNWIRGNKQSWPEFDKEYKNKITFNNINNYSERLTEYLNLKQDIKYRSPTEIIVDGLIKLCNCGEYSKLIHKVAMDVSANRLNRIISWDETGRDLKNLLEKKGLPKISFIVSREYQLSSALSYFLKYSNWPHSIEKKERNLWSPIKEVKKGPSIFVCELFECQGANLQNLLLVLPKEISPSKILQTQ